MRFQSIGLIIMRFLFPHLLNNFEVCIKSTVIYFKGIEMVGFELRVFVSRSIRSYNIHLSSITQKPNHPKMDFLGVEDYGEYISYGATHSFCGRKYMTPSFNQQDLNSCMSCTLSASLGALYAIENAQCIAAPDFSKQEMVDCQPITHSGTRYSFGYGYVFGRGLHTAEEYPYLNEYNSCCRCLELRGRPKISFRHYQFFEHYADAFPFLYHQPLTAGMVLYRSFERFHPPYKSALELLDVYSPEPGEKPLLWADGSPKCHAILVIGFGIGKGKEYFIIKNWNGIHWGVNGYARVTPKLLFYWGISKNISTRQL